MQYLQRIISSHTVKNNTISVTINNHIIIIFSSFFSFIWDFLSNHRPSQQGFIGNSSGLWEWFSFYAVDLDVTLKMRTFVVFVQSSWFTINRRNVKGSTSSDWQLLWVTMLCFKRSRHRSKWEAQLELLSQKEKD